MISGLGKSAVRRPRQVDLPAGQDTFHGYLPDGQGARQIVRRIIIKKGNKHATSI